LISFEEPSTTFWFIIIRVILPAALVWKDRDSEMDEIADATPTWKGLLLVASGYAHRHGDY